jgi:hypothetical protein
MGVIYGRERGCIMKKITFIILVFSLLSGLAYLCGCGEPTIDELIQDLSDSDREYDARWALVEIGEPAVEPLIAALDDGNSEIRSWAMWCLGEIGDPRAVEPLITILHDEKKYWWGTAKSSLIEIGAPAVEPLVACLKEADADVAERACDTLVSIGAPAVEPLIDVLGHSDEDIRDLAFWALDDIGDPAAEPLIAALGNRSFPIQTSVAMLLWRQNDPEVERMGNDFYAHLRELCYGSHDIGTPVPNTIVLLDPSGEYDEVIHPWAYELPLEWTDAPVDSINLIGVVEEDFVTIETCEYGILGVGVCKVYRKQHQVEITLLEVRTGRTVATSIFEGTLPRECEEKEKFVNYASKDVTGDEVSFSQVLPWLEEQVMK